MSSPTQPRTAPQDWAAMKQNFGWQSVPQYSRGAAQEFTARGAQRCNFLRCLLILLCWPLYLLWAGLKSYARR